MLQIHGTMWARKYAKALKTSLIKEKTIEIIENASR